ncbi:MAG: insulinase family protein [Candidatus Omnitrophica bacterium]|nr:insulinase family protein [Candidatus Omnitrophota bacterium]
MSDSLRAAVPSRAAVRQLVLDNGLEAVWEEDHRQPLVAVEVRIKGGLRGEGRSLGTGITHFIEHMLFKGTPSRPPGTIEQEVRRYGGTINAFTSFDATGISLFVESRYLREALALLADILQHAVFDQGEFDKERAVILSEIQMNRDDPQRRLYDLFWSRHFLEHPYRHPILGHRPLLEALTAQELAAFYAAQYQPQHITIACVGDLDGAALPALVQDLFGSWRRGTSDPLQQLVPAEPPSASAKRITDELPVQTAYAMLGFSSVRLADPDLYPLDVLANIVGQGRSSRLYETVVRQRRLAHTITAWNYTPHDPGVFAIQWQSDPEQLDASADAILDVLDAITQHGVSEAELAKAKKAVTAAYLFSLQTVEAKAGDLASSFAQTGDPLFSRRYVEGIDGVSGPQVQAAARRYCDRSVMTLAVIQPPAPATAPPTPETAAPIPVTQTLLDNGTTALIGRDPGLPIAAIVVAFRGGVRVETEESQGLSNLVAQLLIKGTTQRSALEIAQAVESLGGTIEPFSGRDGFGIALQLLAADVPAGLSLAHELVTQSTFPDEELAIQRSLIAKELAAQDDEIFDVGGRLLRQTLFQRHPYRFHPLGDEATLPLLTREQCVAFAKRWLVPSNTVVAVFGDVEAAAVGRQLERSFGATPPGASEWPDRLAAEPLEEVREASRAMEKEQALIMLGFRGSTYTADDRYALDLLTAVLSGMSGRLFQAVREQQGLSYTLGAVHVPGWDPGYVLVYAATRPEEEPRVQAALREQLALVAAKGVGAEEVEQAKRYLIGQHRMDLQHLSGLAKRSALDELYGIGYDAWMTYEAKLNAVTASMVSEAAERYLTMPRRAEVVISPNGQKNGSSSLFPSR